MHIQENVSLAAHSTMRLGGLARYLCVATSRSELPEMVAWAKERSLPIIVVGEGSNIVWRQTGFDGLVIVNRILGKSILSKDDSHLVVNLGAGEDWDEVVQWVVDQGLSGIEALSLIPGTVGATPVQNVGAYGSEIANTLVELEAFELATQRFIMISNPECGFSYRSSRFKTTDKGKFIITSITLKLNTENMKPPFYEVLQTYLDDHHIPDHSPQSIREAVVAIRSSKLPDPKKVANNGSFFANPIISNTQFEALKASHPNVKNWPQPDGRIKLAAGWLVEQAGFKGVHDKQTGMAVWPEQALVIVNVSAKTTDDLMAFKEMIVTKVELMFGVRLEQEPELLP